MDCFDPLLLQRLIDGELDEARGEMVAHHLESCATCRDALKRLMAEKSLASHQLGLEDEGEEEASLASLRAVARRLPGHPTSVQASSWWRRAWIAAAAIAILAVSLPLPFGTHVGISAERILEEAGARERMWEFQPNRSLHWEIDTRVAGIKDIEAGRWRTLFWQKNGATTFAQVSRQYNPSGQIVQAYWRQDDGSSTSYRAADGEVLQVTPTTAAVQAELTVLEGPLRQALEKYLTDRQATRTLEFSSRSFANWLYRPTVRPGGRFNTVRRVTAPEWGPEWGQVYRITEVDGPSPYNDRIIQAVHEHDVDDNSFRRLRLKTTLTYRDGTVGVHDSRWIVFRELDAAAFDAQTPHDLLERGMRVVRLTPLDVARKRLQESTRTRSGTQ